MTLQPIHSEIVVAVSPEKAFEVFADRLGQWWPLAYTFSGPEFETARVEPRVGGRWFERTQRGEELSWGQVRAYERGQRLVLAFGIGPDRKPAPPERSSEVEVRFEASGDGQTRIHVEHRAFEPHGEAAGMLREGMASEQQGWPVILAELRREINLHFR